MPDFFTRISDGMTISRNENGRYQWDDLKALGYIQQGYPLEFMLQLVAEGLFKIGS